MADDRCGSRRYIRVKGRLAKKGTVKRSENMRFLNEKSYGTSNQDHDYVAIPQHSHDSSIKSHSVQDRDIHVSENVEIGPTKPWFQGRRVVELAVLSENMNCAKCNSWLRFVDIVDEVIYGMASYLYIPCPNSACQHVNLVPTGKRNSNKGFDVNSKVYLAMLNAGMGPNQVVKFLSGCNIPPVDASTLRKIQKKLAPVVISAAETSCNDAQKEELDCSVSDGLEVSFDAGWQKRGSGWQYNSHTGHASLIGVNTGKIVDFDMRTRSCSVCQYHQGRTETVPNHECNVNWTGSSKGMEPDMACSMIKRMADKGYEVGTLHADNDTTTQSRLPPSIKKKDDKTHVKKNLSSRLYSLSKTEGKKCHPLYRQMFHKKIVPHIFGDHSLCSPSWCTYNKDPAKFRYKHLPNGKALSGDMLKEELQKLTQIYKDRTDRLLNLGSTQANESFNNSVASFAPKNRFYGGTKSLKARVSSAVMQKNEGYGWLSKVNENVLLSPGNITKLHGIRRDKIRKNTRAMKSTVSFKRKRISKKIQKVCHDKGESVKEGDTYGVEIEVQGQIDTETIPSKIKLTGEESAVVFDLETTGLSRNSDITQLAAYDGSDIFNQYIMPCQKVSATASSITGLTYDFHSNQMYHHGKPVISKDVRVVLLDFIEYLSKKKKPILFGHNIAAYDVPVLLKKLQESHLLSEFLQHITGCIDTLKLARRKFSKSEVGNYKQQNLVSKLLGKEYDAHDASADVTSLHELLGQLNYSEKDIFAFNVTALTDTFTPLMRASLITKPTARRLAQCGLCLRHLQLAFKRDTENGLRYVLSEHGFNAKTVKAVTSFLTNKEE
ncbi:uncharacterized protein LOC110448777 [Mizuhopecten yessoensis]|uniref:uncharacterized protein LOC110448777 n=1 Tax=Mizuhopecten yessoensis TaxID=6573 RepID=UPI000B45AE4F|nr:uncharacterized protein LOC110448777 [Mizuhopecten yessoensis]